MRNLRDLWAGTVVVVVTAVLATGAIVSSFFDRSGRSADRITLWYARAVAWVSGMRVTAEGVEHVQPGRSFILVANHRSHLDSVGLVLTCSLPMRMLAKDFLFRIPIFGQAIRRVGHIKVVREKGKTDMDAVRRQTESLIAHGRCLCVFAEGTRQPAGTIAPFKMGAFVLAKHCRLPIVPVSIVGTGRILPTKSFHFTPGQAFIRYHAPIEPDDLDVEQLREQTFAVVKKSAEELTERL